MLSDEPVGHGHGPIRHFHRFRQAHSIALSWSRYVRLRPGTDIPRLFFHLRILNLNPGWATHPEHSASKRTTPSAKHSSNGSVRLWKSVAACLRARLLLPSAMAGVTDALGAPEATTHCRQTTSAADPNSGGTLRIRGPRGFRADARRSDLSSQRRRQHQRRPQCVSQILKS